MGLDDGPHPAEYAPVEQDEDRDNNQIPPFTAEEIIQGKDINQINSMLRGLSKDLRAFIIKFALNPNAPDSKDMEDAAQAILDLIAVGGGGGGDNVLLQSAQGERLEISEVRPPGGDPFSQDIFHPIFTFIDETGLEWKSSGNIGAGGVLAGDRLDGAIEQVGTIQNVVLTDPNNLIATHSVDAIGAEKKLVVTGTLNEHSTPIQIASINFEIIGVGGGNLTLCGLDIVVGM